MTDISLRRHGSTPPYRLLQQWLILAGAAAFAGALAWDYGIIYELFAGDSTRICLLIAALFIGASLHCAVRAVMLSREATAAGSLQAAVEGGARLGVGTDGGLTLNGQGLPANAGNDYLAALLQRAPHPGAPEASQLTDVLNERVRGGHEFGWFVTGLLVKLGMLGTVIGFVIMLSAVEITPSFDLTTVQRMLTSMSVGMSVALYTTIVGLVTSMVLGLQYLLLDRAADQLVAQLVAFAERRLPL